ncbi:MAG: tail fiber domain-containing protein [Phycisphaerales bacterium]|nr:MAG: tail fiber domain-containing protein [Phycisphaerales bacterium]
MRRTGLLAMVSAQAVAIASQVPLYAQVPVGTDFTYQGLLKQDGGAVNGETDFRFSLWGTEGADPGTQVGPTLLFDGQPGHSAPVGLEDGLFTVALNFGDAVFTGEKRWLMIEVRVPHDPTDTDPYTALAPNQQIAAAPHALALPGLWTDYPASAGSPNILGGHADNAVTDGAVGATIGGGGDSVNPNTVTDDYGVVGGGSHNQAGDNAGTTADAPYATVGGGWSNAASGQFSTVAGGSSNTGSGLYATVGGGELNAASDVSATVSGGSHNTAVAQDVTVGGGYSNEASGIGATVAGGRYNTASDESATISAGYANVATARDATVGGGYLNRASGIGATVAGGQFNEALADFATIGGGSSYNRVYDRYGTISGGGANRAGSDDADPATAMNATVGGGQANQASDADATVSGGNSNIASADGATVGGGQTNTASGVLATIAGGYDNAASGDYSAVGGGANNTANGYVATVGGGYDNHATGMYATIAGGHSSTALGDGFVGGGFGHTASGGWSVVTGGRTNQAAADYATIAGGSYNSVLNGAEYGSIAGGGPSDPDNPTTTSNVVYDKYGAVGGGANNRVGSDDADPAAQIYATVGGGVNNTAAATQATVGGGTGNNASGVSSTIAGGSGNEANNTYATVGGGWQNTAAYMAAVAGGALNTASGEYASVPGGSNNTAGGFYSLAAGRRAKADHDGAFVWADSNDFDFTSTVADTFNARCTGGAVFVSAIDGSGAATAGVVLPAGGGSWSSVCDRDAKENFAPVDPRGIVERLAKIPIETWNYKSQDRSIRHIGPMAQDFKAAFSVGESTTHITTVDAGGVALAAIQGLYDMVQERDTQIAELQRRLEKLERERAEATVTRKEASR